MKAEDPIEKNVAEIFSALFRACRKPLLRFVDKSVLACTSFVSPSGLFGKMAIEIKSRQQTYPCFIRAG